MAATAGEVAKEGGPTGSSRAGFGESEIRDVQIWLAKKLETSEVLRI